MKIFRANSNLSAKPQFSQLSPQLPSKELSPLSLSKSTSQATAAPWSLQCETFWVTADSIDPLQESQSWVSEANRGGRFLINTSAGRTAAAWFTTTEIQNDPSPLQRNTSAAHFTASTQRGRKGNKLLSFFLHLIVSLNFFAFYFPLDVSVCLRVSVSDDLLWSESKGGTATNSNSAPAAALHSNRSYIPQLPYLLDHLSEE